MPNKDVSTGEKIKQTRIQQGLTQKQLAEKCNMYESQIRKYEAGKVNPKIETLQKIANALHVPVDSLRSDFSLRFDSIMDLMHQAFAAMDRSMEAENKLLTNYRSLNEQGKEKAIEQVEMLTKIPEYRAEPQNPAAESSAPSDQDE